VVVVVVVVVVGGVMRISKRRRKNKYLKKQCITSDINQISRVMEWHIAL
jgi:hypothetical protein